MLHIENKGKREMRARKKGPKYSPKNSFICAFTINEKLQPARKIFAIFMLIRGKKYPERRIW